MVPPPILEDGHHPSVWQRLNSLARNVDVPGPVLHHDEKLGGVGLDMMLPPVQGASVEDCASRRLIQSGAFRHKRIVPRDDPCPARWKGIGVRLWRTSPIFPPPMSQPAHPLSRQARTLRLVHTSIGIAELGCLGYVWFCALSRHRDRWLNLSVGVLAGEGVALLLAKGCPLGVFQRRAGDDVPMFELWFGPRVAPIAIPSFTVIALAGLLLVVARPPSGDSETQR